MQSDELPPVGSVWEYDEGAVRFLVRIFAGNDQIVEYRERDPGGQWDYGGWLDREKFRARVSEDGWRAVRVDQEGEG